MKRSDRGRSKMGLSRLQALCLALGWLVPFGVGAQGDSSAIPPDDALAYVPSGWQIRSVEPVSPRGAIDKRKLKRAQKNMDQVMGGAQRAENRRAMEEHLGEKIWPIPTRRERLRGFTAAQRKRNALNAAERALRDAEGTTDPTEKARLQRRARNLTQLDAINKRKRLLTGSAADWDAAISQAEREALAAKVRLRQRRKALLERVPAPPTGTTTSPGNR